MNLPETMSSSNSPIVDYLAGGGFVPAPSVTGRKVLIVDDNPQIRELLEVLLAFEEMNVITAGDSSECLDAMPTCRPDIVLLDVQMPVMNGFEVCRRIKQKPEHRFTPVMLITGLSAVQDRIRGIEAGADDFLTKPIDRYHLVARVKSLLALKSQIDELERAENVLLALAHSIEAKDPYTEGHCERLASMSAELGRRMGLNPEQVIALWRAGIVHDIGKIAIPDAILLKPEKLSKDEWKLMQQHVEVGENICRPLKSFRSVLPIIRHHHEKLDGTGYPAGLKGNEIPLPSRVLQIVDIYDALTSDRPYKRAASKVQSLDIICEEVQRGWRDAAVFGEFCAMLRTL